MVLITSSLEEKIEPDNPVRIIVTFVIEQEEQYPPAGGRTVLWERSGEIPLRDPTGCH